MNNTIAENIIAFRKANGMSQQDLGDMLHVSSKTISRWETGKGMPDLSVLPTIAALFNVSVDELLTGEKNVPISSHTLEKSLNYLVKKNTNIITLIGTLLCLIMGIILINYVLFLNTDTTLFSTFYSVSGLQIVYNETRYLVFMIALTFNLSILIGFIAFVFYKYKSLIYDDDLAHKIIDGKLHIITIAARFCYIMLSFISSTILSLLTIEKPTTIFDQYSFSIESWLLYTILFFFCLSVLYEFYIKNIIIDKIKNRKLSLVSKRNIKKLSFYLLSYLVLFLTLQGLEHFKLHFTTEIEFNTYREYIDYVEINIPDDKAVFKTSDIILEQSFEGNFAPHSIYRDYIVEINITEGSNLPITIVTYEQFMYYLKNLYLLLFYSIPITLCIFLKANYKK